MIIPAFYRHEPLHPIWRISSQGKDILDTQEIELHQGILKLVSIHPSTDQVCYHRNTEGVLDQG